MIAMLLLFAVSGCGGGSSSSPTTSQPLAVPIGSFVTSPPGAPLAGVTTITFNATATDPGGSPLTLTWDFGDGQRGFTGTSVTHVFDRAGTFPVVLTMRSAAGGTATANGTVTVRSLTGTWADLDPRIRFEFTQNGRTLTGRRLGGTGFIREGSVDGTLTDPKTVGFDLFLDGSNCRYEGTASSDANNVTVSRTRNGPNCAQTSYNVTRE